MQFIRAYRQLLQQQPLAMRPNRGRLKAGPEAVAAPRRLRPLLGYLPREAGESRHSLKFRLFSSGRM